MSQPSFNFDKALTLIAAVENGDLSRVKALLQNVAETAPYHDQCLYYCATRGDDDMLQLFLDRGCCPGESLNTALCAAAAHGHPHIVRILLKNRPELDGQSALAHACAHNQVGAARVLIERGADPSLKNAPFFLLNAVSANRRDLTELLLQSGAMGHRGTARGISASNSPFKPIALTWSKCWSSTGPLSILGCKPVEENPITRRSFPGWKGLKKWKWKNGCCAGSAL